MTDDDKKKSNKQEQKDEDARECEEGMSKRKHSKQYEEKLEQWERQSWETAAAFRAFHDYYLVQERPRSVNEAYRRYRAQKGHQPEPSKRAPGTWQCWSQGRKWDGGEIADSLTWRERTAAYDRQQDAYIRAALETRRLRVRLDTADLGKLLRQKAMSAARMLVAVSQQFVDESGQRVRIVAVEMTPHEIARLAEVGVNLERLALGESTETVWHEGDMHLRGIIGVNELADLSDDELDERIRKLLAAAETDTAPTPAGDGSPTADRVG